MKPITSMTLTEMMSEAAAFRGEIQTSDPIVSRMRSASHQIAFGAHEADIVSHLMDDGATSEEAHFAVQAGKLL